jgi:hypothetical protein
MGRVLFYEASLHKITLAPRSPFYQRGSVATNVVYIFDCLRNMSPLYKVDNMQK